MQTGKATEDITSHIVAVQDSTPTAVGAIRQIAARMHEIDCNTAALAAAVEQQNVATGEISHKHGRRRARHRACARRAGRRLERGFGDACVSGDGA